MSGSRRGAPSVVRALLRTTSVPPRTDRANASAARLAAGATGPGPAASRLRRIVAAAPARRHPPAPPGSRPFSSTSPGATPGSDRCAGGPRGHPARDAGPKVR
ncbi:hypothetical protein OPKNFCMD_5521 [Methylobacterium crusticola]|uniref:Uncharacterized protein n=1 Tax=Methylobacterium crusticola TaxID=1697972 RepID=A0ABQ4R692_9HYPH|nr:hypothetical protein OPKNFCMD_5521 [Methylobacterium crusticola]